MNRSIAFIAGICVVVAACASTAAQSHKWTEFVKVDGQPEPVPAEWVSTPEGRFAHSIKIPNPVSKDSGYKPWMSSEAYFKHLCEKEAGEFIFKTVANVEGFYFMRPPKRPTDHDLMDRYRLEAPEMERTFQLYRATPSDRSTIFIVPSERLFRYVEEPPIEASGLGFVQAFGFERGTVPKPTKRMQSLQSRYALTWRGIRRSHDRESGISGGEWIVLDMKTNEVLAVMRNYGLTGRTKNVPSGIWWLNAVRCPQIQNLYRIGDGFQIYGFTSKVLKPITGDNK